MLENGVVCQKTSL